MSTGSELARGPSPRESDSGATNGSPRLSLSTGSGAAPFQEGGERTEGSSRIVFMGCQIDNLTMEETLGRVEEFVQSGKPHQHVVVNVDKIVKAAKDPALREIINRCDLINVDGMPIVCASRVLGRPLKERVTGVDLFERLLERARERGWGVYFLGAQEEVVKKVVQRAQSRYLGLRIVGYRNGYWNHEEEAGIVADIRQARPQLLFVAISSPRKEIFLGRYQQEMGVPFAMGVGGTFDVFVGKVQRAPLWMQTWGLEWFFRFLQEPRRMFKRYFVDDLYFFWLLAREMLRARG